jgi:hypothetical protein
VDLQSVDQRGASRADEWDQAQLGLIPGGGGAARFLVRRG